MPKSSSAVCPLCLLALLGIAILLGVPGLAAIETPLGSAGLLLLWVPLLSALIRQTMLRSARHGQVSDRTTPSR